MVFGKGSAVAGRTVRIGRLLGFLIYVSAFLLPACREVATKGAHPPDSYKGWLCAWVTLINTFSPEVWHSKDFLAILSGWINPLILIYLIILLVMPRLVWPRRIVAGTVVAFMVATWVYFVLVRLVPLAGHVLWIVGALMILAGEVVGRQNGPLPDDKSRLAPVRDQRGTPVALAVMPATAVAARVTAATTMASPAGALGGFATPKGMSIGIS